MQTELQKITLQESACGEIGNYRRRKSYKTLQTF